MKVMIRFLAGDGDDFVYGNQDNDTLSGGAGNDVLDGGFGIDTATGGSGDDGYYFDDLVDIAIENANEGIDTINTPYTHILLGSFEKPTLTGSSAVDGVGNSSDNIMIGNFQNNILTGNGGNDILDGGTGNDIMIGGFYDDTHIMDVITDLDKRSLLHRVRIQ